MRMHVVLTCFSFFLVLSASANEPLGWKPHTIKQGDGRGGWVERPLLFGLLALCLLLLAAEGRLDPRWLVPTMWLWVYTHGSFPLGLVAVGLLAIGRRLDHESSALLPS